MISTNPIKSIDLPMESLKWDLNHSSSTEGQTFYITTDNGDFCFVQMVHSTMSWSPTVQLTARYYGADGVKIARNYNVDAKLLDISSDGLSASCQNLSIQLLSTNPITYHIQFQDSPHISLDFVFTASFGGGFQINDGKTHFSQEDPTAGHVFSRFIPKSVVDGTLVLNDVKHSLKGHGMMVNALQHKPQTAARWNFVNFQSESDAVMMYHFEVINNTCTDVESKSHGCLVLDGRIESVTLDNQVQLLDRNIDDFSGYAVPEKVIHEWNGRTSSGKECKIQMEFELKRLLDKIDVLGELPFLIRKFIQTFVTAPYVYQWFEESTAIVTIGEETREIKGRVFHENTFLSSQLHDLEEELRGEVRN